MCYFPPWVESTLEDKVIWILILVTWQERLMSCVFWQHVAPLISSPEREIKCTSKAGTKIWPVSSYTCFNCGKYIHLYSD